MCCKWDLSGLLPFISHTHNEIIRKQCSTFMSLKSFAVSSCKPKINRKTVKKKHLKNQVFQLKKQTVTAVAKKGGKSTRDSYFQIFVTVMMQ